MHFGAEKKHVEKRRCGRSWVSTEGVGSNRSRLREIGANAPCLSGCLHASVLLKNCPLTYFSFVWAVIRCATRNRLGTSPWQSPPGLAQHRRKRDVASSPHPIIDQRALTTSVFGPSSTSVRYGYRLAAGYVSRSLCLPRVVGRTGRMLALSTLLSPPLIVRSPWSRATELRQETNDVAIKRYF